MIIIKDNVDLDKLLDYGFRKNEMIDYSIYIFDIEKNNEMFCEILVNKVGCNDRILRFYYYDSLDDKFEYKSFEDDEGNCVGEGFEQIFDIDYDVPIPDVIFQLIKDDIVEVIKNDI